ncbi:hypothetical protein VNO77_39433 [Canavalia gladiata]|uniref:Uncharacterized protein n=1 Tax=Canavalia gladiata TaxID=3824 RepID=A0AAN9KB26_CANGL
MRLTPPLVNHSRDITCALSLHAPSPFYRKLEGSSVLSSIFTFHCCMRFVGNVSESSATTSFCLHLLDSMMLLFC